MVIVVEGWGEKEIFFYQGVLMVKISRGVGVGDLSLIRIFICYFFYLV